MPTTSTKGKPVLAGTDAFAPFTHINSAVNWAETFASVRNVTDSTAMNALSGNDVWVGLTVYHTSGTYAGTYWTCTATSGSPATGTWKLQSIGAAPRAELVKTSAQTFSASGTNYDVTNWTSVETRGITVNTTTGVITIVVPGRYNIFTQISYAGNATGARYCSIFKAGTILARTVTGSVGTAAHYQQCSILGVTLAAGDTLTLSANQVSGGSLASTTSGNNFTVEYVGA